MTFSGHPFLDVESGLQGWIKGRVHVHVQVLLRESEGKAHELRQVKDGERCRSLPRCRDRVS
ncbi:MAG: hypothetical protein JRH13_00940 [Deltaproteobacteria bacterium]|nr:hypothetical protein [Deltaproteobacteria bacterium]